MRMVERARLEPLEAAEVSRLVEAATGTDHVAPLSEHALLDVRHGGNGSHLLAYDGTALVGYAHLARTAEEVTAEVVVDPAFRRRGTGTALLAKLRQESPRLLLWSHGHLPAARALAEKGGFATVRELWQMRRPLGTQAPALPSAALPAGFAGRTFEPGRDEAAWLRVNARAFAHHPEQGRMTLADLRLREEEPWFDPAGFFLVEDVTGAAAGRLAGGADAAAAPLLAASHWTKVHSAADIDATSAPQAPASGRRAAPVGEVYVVGVDPAYQGRGLGRAVTALGLHHLQSLGLVEVMLYVDADNAAAVATYSRLGFTTARADVMYLSTLSPAVPR